MMLRSSAWLWRTSQPIWKARESHRSRPGGCSIASGQGNWRWEQTINPNDLFVVTSSFSHVKDPIWLLVTGHQMMNSMGSFYVYTILNITQPIFLSHHLLQQKEVGPAGCTYSYPAAVAQGPPTQADHRGISELSSSHATPGVLRRSFIYHIIT